MGNIMPPISKQFEKLNKIVNELMKNNKQKKYLIAPMTF